MPVCSVLEHVHTHPGAAVASGAGACNDKSAGACNEESGDATGAVHCSLGCCLFLLVVIHVLLRLQWHLVCDGHVLQMTLGLGAPRFTCVYSCAFTGACLHVPCIWHELADGLLPGLRDFQPLVRPLRNWWTSN